MSSPRSMPRMRGYLARLFAPPNLPRQRTLPHFNSKTYHRVQFRRYTSPTTPPKDIDSRAQRILSRLPPSLQKYTTRLRNAPVSHVVAFLVLHELTAILPLFGLFGLFHYTEYVPLGYMLDHYGDYVRAGVKRFERYFKRKGWFGFEAGDVDGEVSRPEEDGEDTVLERWNSADSKYKIVVEVALAYAITKVLLPVRIVGSLWATPWFAGVLVKIRNIAGRKK